MAQTNEYDVVGTLHHNGTVYRPGETVELTDKEAQPLLEASPPPIEEPGAESESPTPAAPTATNPLAPETIAEVEAILPEIEDVERLEAAHEFESSNQGRKGALEAILTRLDEVAEGDEE